MNTVYSHRNGETESPAKEEQDRGGYYWFLDARPTGGMGIFIMIDGYLSGYGPDGKTHVENLRGRWWGPVRPPWETE